MAKVGLKDTLALLAKGYSKKEIDALAAIDEENQQEEQALPAEDIKAQDDAAAEESNPEPDYKTMYEENEDGATYGERCEAVFPGTIKMLQCLLTAAGIERVTVGEERLSAQFLHYIHHCTGIVGTQIADVAHLAEVHLYGHKLAVQVKVGNTGLADKLLQFGG